MKNDFAVIIPMANEADDFEPFITVLTETLDSLACGTIYFITGRQTLQNHLGT